ncbi:DUF2306 domain-containing protein [Lutimonas halocynthiae]|uniref:DUF2306 domain-containing protein n=1 Tax=Lutimonas halocynthiae TaxID=1446477 RepID=UPI0025B46493|nr:DUF2306 domain-containing protein [Lutimonas halocynthiae]MDN3643207.1 DUF2306 domain-containing protein [Lutimonas halocynthiae]
MHDFVNTQLGWFHFITAMLSILAGTYILCKPKGTKLHKQVGYLYVLSMFLVCGSALGVYNITGDFGVFHVLAIAGLVTLIIGLLPLFLKRINRKHRVLHMWFMYYSVLGLYAAFVSELSLRIPEKPSYSAVGIATAIVFIVGSIFIFWKENIWRKYFKE